MLCWWLKRKQPNAIRFCGSVERSKQPRGQKQGAPYQTNTHCEKHLLQRILHDCLPCPEARPILYTQSAVYLVCGFWKLSYAGANRAQSPCGGSNRQPYWCWLSASLSGHKYRQPLLPLVLGRTQRQKKRCPMRLQCLGAERRTFSVLRSGEKVFRKIFAKPPLC